MFPKYIINNVCVIFLRAFLQNFKPSMKEEVNLPLYYEKYLEFFGDTFSTTWKKRIYVEKTNFREKKLLTKVYLQIEKLFARLFSEIPESDWIEKYVNFFGHSIFITETAPGKFLWKICSNKNSPGKILIDMFKTSLPYF